MRDYWNDAGRRGTGHLAEMFLGARSAQALDFLDLAENISFPNQKL
jgi:hypothetical protein